MRANSLARLLSRVAYLPECPPQVRGLEYNKIIPARCISKELYNIDMARSPQVFTSINGKYTQVNVLAQSHLANGGRYRVEFESRRVKGIRTRAYI
jgi:hypothetical protein